MTPEDLKQIADLIGGLSSEMQALSTRFDKVETGLADLREQFHRLDARLERHGGLLQSGSRWVNRINQWSEKVDRFLTEDGRRLVDLEARTKKLEGGNGTPPH